MLITFIKIILFYVVLINFFVSLNTKQLKTYNYEQGNKLHHKTRVNHFIK